MFWNHSKQHSSKTVQINVKRYGGFGTIRNNTALKRLILQMIYLTRFGTIRNNTALKLIISCSLIKLRFGTIRNNTALKRN